MHTRNDAKATEANSKTPLLTTRRGHKLALKIAMNNASLSKNFHLFLTILIGSVWVFHGLYSKISGGIPRHRQIVERILGEGIADVATLVIGVIEVLLGLWIFTRIWRWSCALAQTLALVSMNFLEILLAKDLLISAPGMVALNLGFLSVVWYWATFRPRPAIKG
jgi:DoxX-like family